MTGLDFVCGITPLLVFQDRSLPLANRAVTNRAAAFFKRSLECAILVGPGPRDREPDSGSVCGPGQIAPPPRHVLAKPRLQIFRKAGVVLGMLERLVEVQQVDEGHFQRLSSNGAGTCAGRGFSARISRAVDRRVSMR